MTSPMERPVFVYIIRCGPYVKIGIAHSIAGRLDDLIVGMPEKPYLSASREFPSRRAALDAETELHRWFRRCRTRGEWFRMAPGEACKKLKAYVSRSPSEARRHIAALFDEQNAVAL